MSMTPNWLANQTLEIQTIQKILNRLHIRRPRNPNGNDLEQKCKRSDEAFSILTFFLGCQTNRPESARQIELGPSVPTMPLGRASVSLAVRSTQPDKLGNSAIGSNQRSVVRMDHKIALSQRLNSRSQLMF